MLISFSVKNFMCFKDKVEFDMQPVGSEAKLRKSPLYDSNVRVAKTSNGKELPLLSSSVLYGANASGKSSFFTAIQAMQVIILSNDKHALRNNINSFKLDKETATQPSEFEITILAEDNVIYEFGFIADQVRIHKEWLCAYPKGRIQKLYERTHKVMAQDQFEYNYQFSPHLHGNKKTWSEATPPNRLFLATAIQLNNTQLLPMYEWFEKTYVIENDSPASALTPLFNNSFSVFYFNQNDEQKKEILDFLNAADLTIEEMKIEKKPEGEVGKMKSHLASVLGNQSEQAEGFAEFFMQGIGNEISTYHLSSDDELVKFNFNEESEGTQKMFQYSGVLLKALEVGSTLFIDELDNSLHPLLVRYIIDLFNNRTVNPNGAQLIFTTHDSSLLHADELFRHDQIWFCDKNKQQASELYSLSEFKKPRKDHVNYEALYLSGRYGAIPFVKSFWPNWDDKNA